MRVPRGNVEIGKKGGANQAPPFCSTLSQQPPRTRQKNPMMQVFRGSWRKNAKCMPCMAHHLLPLPIWVNGSERRLRAMQKRSVWGRLHLNILFNINNLPWQCGWCLSQLLLQDNEDDMQVVGRPLTIAEGGQGGGLRGHPPEQRRRWLRQHK